MLPILSRDCFNFFHFICFVPSLASSSASWWDCAGCDRRISRGAAAAAGASSRQRPRVNVSTAYQDLSRACHRRSMHNVQHGSGCRRRRRRRGLDCRCCSFPAMAVAPATSSPSDGWIAAVAFAAACTPASCTLSGSRDHIHLVSNVALPRKRSGRLAATPKSLRLFSGRRDMAN